MGNCGEPIFSRFKSLLTKEDLSTLVHMKSTDDTSEPVAEAENPLTPENMDDDDNKKSQTYSGKRLVKVGYIKYVSLVILTVQNAALGLSMRYARTRENVEMFSSAAAVVMAEVFKLLICIVLVMQESGNVKNGLRSMYATVILNVKDTLRVCVPSFLYIVQNNLLYVSASNLDAATYQDLSTLVHMKSTDDTSEPVAEAENPLTPENMDDDDNKKSQTYSGKRLVKVGYIKYVSLVILTVQNAALGLSMRYARTRENVEMFSSAAAVVMAEVFKLLICIVLVMQESGNVKNGLRSMYATVILNVKDTLRVCVPSFLYIVQNNLLYVSASNLDAATYQVTYQLKILTTAFFAVVVLKRKLKKWQWLALGILAAGVALVQLSSTDKTSTKTSSELPEQSKVLGFSAALAACFISGFAGIYFEKVLKESDISVWMRNVQLSLLSLPFGTATYLFNGSIQDLLKGFDAFVWYLVLLQAAGGLIVAVVVKYADNILKGFATSVAIIISCVVSIYIFNFILTIQFAAGTTLVIASIFLYGYVPKKKPETRSSLSV